MDTKFDKSVSNNESGVLAKLWRKIISENNLLPQIGMLINKYLDEDETNQRVQAYKKKNRSTLTENIFPVLFLGIVNTGIGCYLYFSSIQQLPAGTVAICGYLDPLCALIFSALFLHEKLSLLQIFGVIFILSGAILAESSKYIKEKISETKSDNELSV